MQRLLPFLLAILFVGFLTSCARPPELVGIDNAKTPVASVENATKHKIFIMTTREATDGNGDSTEPQFAAFASASSTYGVGFSVFRTVRSYSTAR